MESFLSSVVDQEVSLPLSASQLITTTAVIVFCFYAQKLKRVYDRRQELQRWIQRARQERASKEISTLQKDAPTLQDDVHSLSARDLAEKIRKNQYKMLDVVAVFAKYAREHGRNEDKVNAITEELYDEAYAQAEELSSDHAKNKSKPLYGVPISIKECYSVTGCYSTGGLACRLRARQQHDSLMVELMKKAGALPLCLSNTVQTMMLSECVNNIWGRSRNPWDLKRTPGGSSGGDAAMVAMKCVPLAVGGDIGGSIRIPASSCGIVGFKPTPTRLSMNGNMRPRMNDRQGTSIVIPATVAPLARTVDCCALFMESVCVEHLWKSDRNVAPLPFDKKKYEQKGVIKVGYFKTDHWFHPSAASLRAMDETIQKLTKLGYTCVEMDPPTDGWFNYELLMKVNSAEGNLKSFLGALEGEALIPEFSTLRLAMCVPDWLRWMILQVDSTRRGYLLGITRKNGISVYELWQVLADLIEMRKKWSDAMQAEGIEAMIFPALPLPAMPHGIPGKLSSAVSYMFIANLLQWPSGTVPVTTVRPDEEHYDFEEIPENQRDSFGRLAQTVMKGSSGLPMSVSVMTPAFQDETCLKVMKDIESVAKFTAEPKAYLSL